MEAQQPRRFRFEFGRYACEVTVGQRLPRLPELSALGPASRTLLVCDRNTEAAARAIGGAAPLVVLPPGEAAKGWPAVETILRAAVDAGLGRDGLFVGVGGGVVTDMTAFAASIYMRGARLALVPTTLLGMADAALGGKTGIDLFDIKNLAGTFRPADSVYMATEALGSLSDREFDSGMAEVIKTGIIGDGELLTLLEELADGRRARPDAALSADIVARCVAVKGRIVEADPTETGTERALLNLGHTYGHALESMAGLGKLTHGEAVAWGMARACRLGALLGYTGKEREARILRILSAYGYDTAPLHPAALAAVGGNAASAAAGLSAAMAHDKKKKEGKLRFIVPKDDGATMVDADAAVVQKTLLGGLL